MISSKSLTEPDRQALPLRVLPFRLRWKAMLLVAFQMAMHDRQKTVAAVMGVAFAFVLIAQNVCATQFYLKQSTNYVDNAGADLWVTAPGTKYFSSGPFIPAASLHQALTCPGVDWAEPVIVGVATIRLPNGGAENIILVGARAPAFKGGPFNIIVGERDALLGANTVFFEDVEREKLGGLNLDSNVEINQHRVRVGGFTWGLTTVFGPYIFADYDFARVLLGAPSDRTSYVLVGLSKGVDRERVKRELQQRMPESEVLTTEEFDQRSDEFTLIDAGIAGILIMAIFVGVTVGLAIVGLSMTSAVQHNLREFGTLKAIGATNGDLRLLLFIQALAYSVLGSFAGSALVCALTWLSRSARLNMIVQPQLLFLLVPFVTIISMVSAIFALRSIRKLEPASVFR